MTQCLLQPSMRKCVFPTAHHTSSSSSSVPVHSCRDAFASCKQSKRVSIRMGDKLPFLVEYAKTGRARCQGCKKTIESQSLRIAKVVQSPFHDGTIVKWFDSECFFNKQRPKSTADISHFDNIRWEDQEFIKNKIEELNEAPEPTIGKGKKRGATSNAFKDFTVDSAKSDRSICVGCEGPIIKGDIRISKKDFESEKGVMYNGIDRWHHLDCFEKLRADLSFFEVGTLLPGAANLSAADQEMLTTKLPKIKAPDLPPLTKKMKNESDDPEEEKQLKEQNEKIFKMRDQLKSLSKAELETLIQQNAQYKPEGQSEMLDLLADLMVFGALKPCKKCTGRFTYVSGLGYKCTGNLTEWTKCEEVTQDPERDNMFVPGYMQESWPFLESWKTTIMRRIVRVTAPSTSSPVKKEKGNSGPKVRKPMPLKGMQFVILSSAKRKEKMKREIMNLGGMVSTKINGNIAAIIATQAIVDKNGTKVDEAREADVHIVSEDFVDEAKDYTDSPIALILKKSICDWGSDPSTRVAATVAKLTSHEKSVYEKSSADKVKLRLKGGFAVDPASKLEDVTHIYRDAENTYTATLGITDIQTKKNSYYKMQILKDDKEEKYWFFRSWGRIGTMIGNTTTESMSQTDCIEKFRAQYMEKTGNEWQNRDSFKKMPNKMYPIDIDCGEDDPNIKDFDSNIKSELKTSVQDLLKLIFDVKKMKKVMLEFDLDTDKMPLGKLSQQQLHKALCVLSELQDMKKKGEADRLKWIDACNRFYTLVPHSFGIADPPLIESEEDIMKKWDMINSLLDIEIAYRLRNAESDETRNPLDIYYGQLCTEIDVLDKNSEEYDIIKQYVKNTHGATHREYNLIIEDVFVIKRQGEEERFKPFEKMENRKLLWHGSRTTNFVGILSQGLRIAPPEAPCNGYMFGKGVYFADMVSKSANYCCADRDSPIGLLMLCEVALGNMYECYRGEYITKLPPGKHSTKAVGLTQPHPDKFYKTKDGLEIPYGRTFTLKSADRSALFYNEYIVYDVAQIKAKYLVKMKFDMRY